MGKIQFLRKTDVRMLVSALAAMVMFAAPEASQAGAAPAAPPAASAKAKARKVCHTVPSSESRLPRKVCVIEAPAPDTKAETAEAQPPADASKSE